MDDPTRNPPLTQRPTANNAVQIIKAYTISARVEHQNVLHSTELLRVVDNSQQIYAM